MPMPSPLTTEHESCNLMSVATVVEHTEPSLANGRELDGSFKQESDKTVREDIHY